MMKSKKSFKILISIILLLNYISFTSFTLINKINYKFNSNSPQTIANYNKLKYSSSWTLSNIYINNNWSETANNYDWCNYENGYYIIENISIIGGVYAKNGIHIENTTEKFIIRNCQINEGIALLEISNGQLINNTITFGQMFPTGMAYSSGLYMRRCNDTIIEFNILNDSDYLDDPGNIYSIMLYACNNITIGKNILSTSNSPIEYSSRGISLQGGGKNINIINNTIYNYRYGIDISHSSFCKIINNSIFNSLTGLSVNYEYNIIVNNIIKNSYKYGIQVLGSNNSIFNNKLDENDYGFYLKKSSYNIISNNTIQESKKYGIYLESSNYNLITRNHITNVKGCIKEINCNDNIINNNICQKIPKPIFGYFPWMVIGILIITTLLILKIKVKK